MKTILFTSLYPKDPYGRNEINNTTRMIKDYRDKYGHCYCLRLLLASAHNSTIEILKKEIASYIDEKVSVEFLLCPFDYKPGYHNEERGHEISFCKEFVAKAWKRIECDYIFYTDSDTYVSMDDVSMIIKSYLDKDKNSFYRFPYILREGTEGALNIGVNSFGCFIHHKQLLIQYDYIGEIYKPSYLPGGQLGRGPAPDCNIYLFLKKRGAREIICDKVTTNHYCSKNKYLTYKNGEKGVVNI